MPRTAKFIAYSALAALAIGFAVTAQTQERTLINVSHDPAREFYAVPTP